MTPSQHYSQRLDQRERLLARVVLWDGRIGAARLSIAAGSVVTAWSVIARTWPAPWLLAAAGLFGIAVLCHRRLRVRRAFLERSVAWYRAGLERLRRDQQGEAAPDGPAGDRFSDHHHVYGADLDLFGRRGLYARLCTARTPMGERLLADWLLVPADVATIRDRQSATIELRGRLDLREALAVLGDRPRIGLHPDALAAWIDAPPELPQRRLRVGALTLVVLAGATGVLWAVTGIAFPFLGVLAAEAVLHYALRDRVHRSIAGIENAYEDLKLLATLLGRIESESFETPRLRTLVAALSSPPFTAAATLSMLSTRVHLIEARRNPLLAPLMLPLLYAVWAALAAERWRRLHGAQAAAWLRVLGEIEALESIAGYAFERPEDTFPEFLPGTAAFTAQGLGHPLIPAGSRVRNDVALSGATRVLLVSGSNMSGKSTLLRSVGLNAILAMAGAPVCARRLELTPLQVGASIRVNDSLDEGSSRFYAEIARLRQLFEPSPLPLLFLLDELLQGTNSTDRRIGAQGIVKALIARGAIGCITTHDLDLTRGLDLGHDALRDVHFQDELRDGRLTFDFMLRDGVVTRSNGVELMRAIGLDV